MKTERRNNLELCTSAERSIFDAMQEVEKVGADPILTESINLLTKAKDLVGDFIDKQKTGLKDLISFDDLCNAVGITEAGFEAMWKDLPVSQTLKTVAKFEIMSDAINQNWRPDTLDRTEKKWFPIFSVSSSGLDFSGSSYYYGVADANAGFPFAFKTKEQSDHSGKQFIKLWEELILRKIS